PGADTDAHRRVALPHRIATPAGAVVLKLGHDTLRGLRVAERDEHLVEHHVVENLEARVLQSFSEAARLATVALHELGEPRAPERSERGPEVHAARTARHLERVVGGRALRR